VTKDNVPEVYIHDFIVSLAKLAIKDTFKLKFRNTLNINTMTSVFK